VTPLPAREVLGQLLDAGSFRPLDAAPDNAGASPAYRGELAAAAAGATAASCSRSPGSTGSAPSCSARTGTPPRLTLLPSGWPGGECGLPAHCSPRPAQFTAQFPDEKLTAQFRMRNDRGTK